MKKLIAGALVVSTVLAAPGAGSLLTPAPADAYVPLKRDRIDAKGFARNWWATSHNWTYGDGRPNCYAVRFVWRRFAPFERGNLAYVPTRSDCVIVFNARVDWGVVPRHGLAPTWWRFCATVMHEWGHLRGMPYNWRNPPIHSHSPNNIMAWNEGLSARAWWWPYFPGCRYDGDGLG